MTDKEKKKILDWIAWLDRKGLQTKEFSDLALILKNLMRENIRLCG